MKNEFMVKILLVFMTGKSLISILWEYKTVNCFVRQIKSAFCLRDDIIG